MQLTQFVSEHEGFAIRAVHIDEQEWFIAKDVCDVLGIKNSRQAVSKLDEDEVHGVTLNDAIGREQVTSSVNESGLYALILRSKKPQARAFRKWVTSEVLPAIRKTGGYSIGGDPAEIVRMEVESLARKITAVGVPAGQAERAARAAFREKLNAMRAALTGRAAYVRESGQGNGGFSMAYRATDLLELLASLAPIRTEEFCEKACVRFGMGRATFYRMLARLRRESAVGIDGNGALYVSSPLLIAG